MEPSGPQWVERFPGSTSLDDLLPDFRQRTRAFLRALETAGASVRIAATFRPPERAWLMHWSWLVAHNIVRPEDVPCLRRIPIAWQHGNGPPDAPAACAAARAMVRRYAIRYRPTLVSRHIQRRAIDMTIAWKGALRLRDAGGVPRQIATLPRNGLNRELIEIGKGFGVVKLLSDPPHWSDDGH